MQVPVHGGRVVDDAGVANMPGGSFWGPLPSWRRSASKADVHAEQYVVADVRHHDVRQAD